MMGELEDALVEEILYAKHGEMIAQWLVETVGEIQTLVSGLDVDDLQRVVERKREDPSINVKALLMELHVTERTDA